MCFKPVFSKAGVGYKGNGKWEGTLHFLKDNGFHTFLFLRIDAEIEFIVYLKDHLRTDTLRLETLMDVYHCHLDNVGCSALYGCIDGISFSKASNGSIG